MDMLHIIFLVVSVGCVFASIVLWYRGNSGFVHSALFAVSVVAGVLSFILFVIAPYENSIKERCIEYKTEVIKFTDLSYKKKTCIENISHIFVDGKWHEVVKDIKE